MTLATVRRACRVRSGRGGAFAPAALLPCLLLLLFLHACTGETVTEVSVSEVEVSPPSVSAIVGESVRLNAVVRDELGEALEGVALLWSSDDPDVAAVDASGMVQARSSGSVLVRATYEGVSGTSEVRVFPGPGIATSSDSVALLGAVGRPPPPPQVVHITNEGTGTVEGLEAETSHSAGDPAWLTATLDRSTAPASLTLAADVDGLAAGIYRASVTIASSTPDVPSTAVVVTLRIAGVTLRATGGSTVVSESGGADSLHVVLDSQPVSDVVLRVTSGDPGEATVSPTRLTFTAANWSAAQAIAVTGVDDETLDGDEVTTVTVSVDVDASDPAYDLVADLTAPVTTRNDDVAALEVSETGGSTVVTEGGGTDQIAVVLTGQPATDVEVVVTVTDPTEVTASPDRLIFTRTNWSTPQAVTLRGADDAATDGDQVTSVVVSVDARASDDAYDGADPRTVSVTTTDDDLGGFAVSESGGSTSVDENGGTDDLSVVLTAEPARNVVLDVASSDPLEVVVSPTRLTFAPADWSSPRAVTVTGVDDATIGGVRTATVTVAVDAAASDDAFDAVPSRAITVTTRDDDLAGFSVFESGGGTVVGEGGSADDFSVVLDAAPATDVTLNVTSGDPTEAAVTPTRLTFTPATWSAPQVVTVTGVDDPIADGSQLTVITVSVDPAASDDAYDGAPDASVTVTTTDDDAGGLAVSETGGSSQVTEAGGTDQLSIALTSQPISDVTVDVTVADPGEVTAAPTRLTFTPPAWSTPQTVTLTGVDDPAVDGDQTTLVTASVDAAASDDAYDAAPSVGVSVVTLDDDVAGLTVVESGGTTAMPEGGTDDFTVALSAAPLTPVVLAISSADLAVATVLPGLLTFGPSDWSSPQTVTVSGTEDAVVDGSQVTTVTVSVVAALSNAAYGSVADATISVTTLDNDAIAGGGGDG